MRDASTRQRLSGSMLLVVNGRARPGARAGFRVTRASQFMLVLLTALFSAVAGNASAETPFVPIALGTFGGHWSEAIGVNDSGQVVGYSSTASGPRCQKCSTRFRGRRRAG